MRVVAVHDMGGNIVSVIAAPADAPPVVMRLEPGQQMREIDVPGLSLDMDDAQLHSRLDEIMETSRVELPAEADVVPKAPLIRKETP